MSKNEFIHKIQTVPYLEEWQQYRFSLVGPLLEESDYGYIPVEYTDYSVYHSKVLDLKVVTKGEAGKNRFLFPLSEENLLNYISQDIFPCWCDSGLNLYYIGIDGTRWPSPIAVDLEFQRSMEEPYQGFEECEGRDEDNSDLPF